MTFKDLKLKLAKLQGYTSNQNNQLDILKGKPFWIWNKEDHIHEYDKTNGSCCIESGKKIHRNWNRQRKICKISFSESSKIRRVHALTGDCLICRGIPDYCLIYDLGGVSKVERYCSSCLDKERTRGEWSNDYDESNLLTIPY